MPKQVQVRQYTREGGREFVNSYSRLDPREVMALMGKKSPAIAGKATQLQKPSTNHLTAELLAAHTYKPDVGGDALPSGYTLAETHTDPKTGLAVSVYTSPQGKPVVSFRGTEGARDVRDVMTDLDPRGVGYGQFENNKAKLAELASKYPGATVTGHSLGGALAQRYAANFAPAVGEVITFNAPGIDKATSARFKGSKKVTHYISDGDPVSLGGEAFIDGTAKVISFKSGKIPIVGNTLDKHMAAVQAGLIGNPDAQVRVISAKQLSDRNFRYGSARATGNLTRGGVESKRQFIGTVASPLQPVVGLAGQALGMLGIGG